MDESARRRIMQEVAAEKLIRDYAVYHPDRLERTMNAVAGWMISIGERLRRRYEVPPVSGSCCASESHP